MHLQVLYVTLVMDGLRVNKNCEHNNPTKIGAMTKAKYINLETL